MRLTETEGSFAVELEVRRVGSDLLALLTGGAAHLGCAVLAVPRPSLACPEEISCTSSVLNQVGHKDEYPCRKVAETLCTRYGVPTVCTGGIHYDDAAPQDLEILGRLVERLLARLPENLESLSSI